MVHKNDKYFTGNNNSYITRLSCHLGKRGGRRMKKAKQGAFHGTNRIILEDTERDRLSHGHRVMLNGECGFNQKGFDFLMEDTFVSLNDLKQITNWTEYEKQISKQESSIKEQFKNFESIIEFLDDPKKKIKRTIEKASEESLKVDPRDKIKRAKSYDFKAKVEARKYFAGITKIRTKLKIRNILPVYNAHVIVHLCRSKDPFDLVRMDDLFESVSNTERNAFGDGIRPDRLYKADVLKDTVEDFKFKASMTCALETKLNRIECFYNSTKIVKSWSRKLPEHSQWHLDITEHLGDGIYLNNLMNFKKCSMPTKTPMNYFFVIEYFGDPRASVTRNKDNDTFNGYSPVKLSYRFSQEIHFIVNQNEPDKPIVLSYPTDDGAFDSDDLAKEFYPTRQTKFNVDFDNIKIDGSSNNKKSKNEEFTLDLSTDIVSTSVLKELTESLENLGVDKDILNNLTEDDLPFNTTDEFYFEPHHDPPKGTDPDEDEEDTAGGLRNVQR